MNYSDWLKQFKPCDDGYRYARDFQTLAEMWSDIKNPTWMIWLLNKAEIITCDDQRYRLFACWVARNTPLLGGHKLWDLLVDDRSRNSVEVAERFARGEATTEELDAAWRAAKDAIRDAASNVACCAAKDNARAAARSSAIDATWAVLFDAAGSGSMYAARSSAMVAHADYLRGLFSDEIAKLSDEITAIGGAA